jgi:hypothetical protein
MPKQTPPTRAKTTRAGRTPIAPAKRAKAKSARAERPPVSPKKARPARKRHAAPRTRPLPTLGLRMKIGDAMRAIGLDEPRLARLFRALLGRLNKPRSEKLLLEAIKESCRLLEAYPPSRPASGGASHAPYVPITLVTFVPRPARETPALPASAAGSGGTVDTASTPAPDFSPAPDSSPASSNVAP